MAEADFTQVQYAFAAHIRDPENNPPPRDVEDRRMAVYRELFYNNVEGFLADGFPVLRSLYEDDTWHAMARDFYASHYCRSPLFMEIPREFLSYLEQERGEREEDPPFLRELAHYEWVELALSIAEASPPPRAPGDGDLLDNAPVLSSLAWPLSYAWPVHRIGPDFRPEQPGEHPTYLLLHRDEDEGRIHFLELNAISARLFALLQEQQDLSGRAALETIAAELNHPRPQVVIEGGHEILHAWRRRGIVLGVVPVRTETMPQQ